jgi:hypothetical protein
MEFTEAHAKEAGASEKDKDLNGARRWTGAHEQAADVLIKR